MSMRQETLAVYRRRVIAAAEGRVLETGVGSGINLRYYSPRAEHVIGIDPSAKLLSIAGAAKKPPAVCGKNHSQTGKYSEIQTIGGSDPFSFRVTTLAETFTFDLKDRLAEDA